MGSLTSSTSKGQPTAIAGRGVQKLNVIAYTAKIGDVRVVFFVASVSGAFIGAFHGDQRLELTKLGWVHLVDFFQAD